MKLFDVLKIKTDFDVMLKMFEGNFFRKSIPPEIRDYPVGKILVIAPHQDDGIIGAGGSLLKAMKNDKKFNVQCVYITNGSHKNDNRLVQIRAKEAKIVWSTFGVKPIFLGLKSHSFALDNNSINILGKVITDFGPDVIFLPFFLDPRDDHRKSCQLFFEVGKKKNLKQIEVWSYQVTSILSPNVVVDITNEFKAKKKLNELWKSQNTKMNYVRIIVARDIFNSIYYKKNGNRPKSQAAELFFVLPINKYIEICKDFFGDTNART